MISGNVWIFCFKSCLCVCWNVNPPPFTYGLWNLWFDEKNVPCPWWYLFPSKNALHFSISCFFTQVKKTIKWQCRQKKVDICYKTSESVSSLPLESSNLIFFIATAHLSGEACEVSPGGGRGWLIFFGLKLTLEVQVNYFLNGFFHSIKEGCTMSNSSGLLFEWSFWLPGRNQWKNKTFEFRPYPKWPTRPADVFIQRKSFECLKFHKAGCDIGLMSWPLKS